MTIVASANNRHVFLSFLPSINAWASGMCQALLRCGQLGEVDRNAWVRLRLRSVLYHQLAAIQPSPVLHYRGRAPLPEWSSMPSRELEQPVFRILPLS